MFARSQRAAKTAIVAGLVTSLPVLTQCFAQAPAGPAPRSPTPASMAAPIQLDTVATGLEHPWALAFLPDGRILVTERPGRLRVVATDGTISAPLTGVPRVFARSQGGLLDVALDPAFAENQLVYLSYAEPGEGETAGTAVARGRLAAGGLENVEVIYQQQPKVTGGNHFGSRLVFSRDGKLFVTQGDRGNYREQAQDLSSGLGKIMRINPDGSVPDDNPFIGRTDTLQGIWSYGHRNVQAAALHPETGELWEIEHGPRGGDELNQPEAGLNYGWPVITYGINYSGSSIGEGSTKAGMEQPVYYWNPVIAPSGMLFYTGNAFSDWTGSLFVGSLQPGLLVRLTMADGRVTSEERYLGGLGMRIRDVEQGPDGRIYFVTDHENGQLLSISPAGVGAGNP